MIRILAIGLVLLNASSAIAQTAPVDGPTTDVSDVWHAIRHKDDAPEPQAADTANPVKKRDDYLVIAPTIGSKPTTGLTAGFNGNVAFFKGGDPDATHISSMSAGLRVSQKGQVLSGMRYSVFTAEDRWFLQGDNRMSWTSLNTYALGAVPQATGTENVDYDFIRLYETAFREISPGLFVGGGLNLNDHSNVRAHDGSDAPFQQSAYAAYSRAHHFDLDGQRSVGGSLGIIHDTRDNAINASRGSLASATYRSFFTALGGDSNWQEVSVDLRAYRTLSRDARHKLAFWMLGDFVTGGIAPYFDLPAIAGDGRSARGYGEGRYRGEHLMYGEVEYRSTLTANGLLGYVAFLNTTTVSSADNNQALFSSYAPGAGGGLRVLLNKRSKTNLCADYGWGKAGSRGFYLSIQEAF
ncbi:MAG TPA: BamA/TamA family outer membrane protein [Vicinamibacterales bacterium]|nr:BamA/TamA family outer membrane protein [Vicinamibacterales bacterium]